LLIRRYKRDTNQEDKDTVLIPLFYFLSHRTGVSRHAALTCAVLVEKAIERGYLKGKVNIKAKECEKDERLGSKHVWCSYNPTSDKEIILDVAGKFLGYIENSKKWNYNVHAA
jgi:hypothetical protein